MPFMASKFCKVFMWKFLFLSVISILSLGINAQAFMFNYNGPDTLYVNSDCEVALDWGHPDQPTVSSLVGAQIDSFYIFSISNDYEINELVSANQIIEISYKAVDDQGNEALFSFEIVVYDNIQPLIISGPQNEIYECDATDIISKLESWYNTNASIVAEDNCAVVVQASMTLNEAIISFNQSINESCGNTRFVSIDFTITDEAGNDLPVVSANFKTRDTIDPEFGTNPSSLNIECAEDVDQLLENWLDNVGGANATDNCTAEDDLIWSFNWMDNNGNGSYEYVGNKPYDLQMNKNICSYSVTVSIIVEDACGNKEAKTSFILIQDENAPVFTYLPQDTTVSCQDIPASQDLVAIDACKGELIVLFEESTTKGSDPTEMDFYNYLITRTWSADDGCGHDIQHTRKIEVIDTLAPSFDVPDDITVSCQDYMDTDITGVPSSIIDNCSTEGFAISFEDEDAIESCSYTLVRNWKVTDVSGNQEVRSQILTIQDNDAPEMTIEPQHLLVSCDDQNDLMIQFNDWITELGGAEFSDACNLAGGFAALNGSYQLDDPSTYPGTLPGTDFLFSCLQSGDQLMFSQSVDFVFYDDCGNALYFTRNFSVVDEIDPVFDVCPSDSILFITDDSCILEISLPGLLATDNCSGLPFEQDHTQIFQIDSEVPGDKNIPVDTTLLHIGPINLFELDIVEILNIQFNFFNIDGDDVNEYFVIRGENEMVLDTTPELDEECGDFIMQLGDLIDEATLTEWLSDGYLDIWLEPKRVSGGGIFSINDICGNSYVEVALNFNSASVSSLDYTLSLNESEISNYNPEIGIDTILSAGSYTLEYKVMDCSANESVCIQTIQIKDEKAPEIICPSNLEIILKKDSCNAIVQLPTGIQFNDNCMEQWQVERTAPVLEADRLINFSYDADLDVYIANNKNFIFEDIAVLNYARQAVLTVHVQGDFDLDGELFELLDENGQLIGTTPLGDCSTINSASFNIDEVDFNAWKQDGSISFNARSVIGQETVNPCDPGAIAFDGDTDGISSIWLTLEFETLDLTFYVEGATTIALTPFTDQLDLNAESFNGGLSTLYYILTDLGENSDTCSFELELIDEEKPVAQCKGAVPIFLNPSGLEDYILQPEELDNGSYDNCGIDSMAVNPSVFDCTMDGQTIEVMLYVWDNFGNIDSCASSVKVETIILQPTYQAGLCAFDTLKLFANLPDAPDDLYSILWNKEDNGFSSNDENPVRPNADASFSGTYSLQVTGLNGCTSSGFVEVFIEDLSTPILETNADSLCVGDQLILETNSYSGNVVYKWYQGLAPNGSLIDSTTAPILELEPTAGAKRYYVVVESQNCLSTPSANKDIMILETPVASVNDPFIELCEDDDLVLSTNVSGSGFEYLWWGPDSYLSYDQSPAVIENVDIKNQGTYRLAIFNKICSDTTLVEVLVNEKPVTPVIDGEQMYCEEENIILTVANITNADTYSWYLDGDLYTVENTNTLFITGAQSLLSGDWSVQAKEGDCYSDTSAAHPVFIEIKYEISADNSGPVCAGDSISLFAPDIPGAVYVWESPANDTLNIQNPFVLAENGMYRLEIITSAGCVLNASTFVDVVEIPQITALSNNAPKCIDGDECIEFFPSVFPNLGGYAYSWIGPAGFTSSDSIATICGVNPDLNGLYSLSVSNGNCISDTVMTLVEMTFNPQIPILEGTESLCENDTIILTLQNYAGADNDFYWSTPNGNIYQTSDPILMIPHADQNDIGSYSVQAFNGICYSGFADSIFVEVIDQPNQPAIWTDSYFCEGEAIYLHTNYVPNASYYWEGPNGFSSVEQNPVIFPSELTDEGVYRLIISVDGCYSELSEGLTVHVVKKPETPEISGESDPVCVSDETAFVELCITEQIAGVSYNWYHNNTSTLIRKTSANCITITDFDGFVDGLNGFYVIGEFDGCVSFASELFQIQLNFIPDLIADAGDDIELCDELNLRLDAKANLDGYWTSLNQNILINNNLDPKSGVAALEEGSNLFVWSLSHGVCLDYDADTVNISITETPEPYDDVYQLAYNGSVEFQPDLNDLFGEDCTVYIDPEDINWGILDDIGDNQFVYSADPAFVGELQFPYVLSNNYCPEKAVSAMITIQVGDAVDCFGVNVITPNGDGVNDNLHFPCLVTELYPKNKITIFNQWGDEVYHKTPYQNDWYGTYRGEELPVGTYYYLLDLRNGTKPIKGFFVIER